MGKLLDLHFNTQMMAQLFKLPLIIAQIMAISLIVLELMISLLIWKAHIPKILVIVPLVFLITALLCKSNQLNCGCFCALP